MRLSPDLVQQVSLVLLLAVGLSLLLPMVGGPMPPLGAVAAVLALRFLLQVWLAVTRPERRQLASLALTGLLLALLLAQGT